MTVMNTNSTPEEQPKKNKPKMKKVPVENRQQVSIKSIVVDYDLQSRVEMSTEHTIMIGKRIADGLGVDPVIVFFDGKKYWLADGFHRIKAHIKAGLDFIWAYVKQGTKRDAMIYSAGANQQFSLERKPEDIKKAVFMLLADPEWFGKADAAIGNHCGVSPQTAKKYRLEYCRDAGVALPETITRSDGQIQAYTLVTKRKDITPKRYDDGKYRCQVHGKFTHLGVSESQAKERIDEINRVSARYSQPTAGISKGLTYRGILATPGRFRGRSLATSYYTGQFIFDIAVADDVQSLRNACLNVLVTRQARCPNGTPIVVCDHAAIRGDLSEFIDTLKSMGIEFLTIEEFYERLGVAGDDDNAGSLVLA